MRDMIIAAALAGTVAAAGSTAATVVLWDQATTPPQIADATLCKQIEDRAAAINSMPRGWQETPFHALMAERLHHRLGCPADALARRFAQGADDPLPTAANRPLSVPKQPTFGLYPGRQ